MRYSQWTPRRCAITAAYNDALSCVQWCQYAKKCVGEEMYEHMMEIARQQRARTMAERQARKLAKEKEALNA